MIVPEAALRQARGERGDLVNGQHSEAEDAVPIEKRIDFVPTQAIKVIATVSPKSNQRGRSMMRAISRTAEAAVKATTSERPWTANAIVPPMNARRITSIQSRTSQVQSP